MEDKQRPWMYNGFEVTPDVIPEWAVGFIYKIVVYSGDNMNHYQKYYIGKKTLTSTRKKKIGIRAQKKQKEETGDGRVKKVQKVVKSSGWENYWSSSDEIRAGVLVHPERYHREILKWCFSKKNMTYLELKYQFKYNVLENDTYNHNLMGSLYRHDTDRELYEQFLQRKRDKKVTIKPTE